MLTFVSIKPLSVNEAFQGKKYRTAKYDKYIGDLLFLLPNNMTLPEPPYSLTLVFGVSNMAADVDNPAKPFIDCLQKKYKFNDKLIHELTLKKELTPKGREHIGFFFKSLKVEKKCNHEFITGLPGGSKCRFCGKVWGFDKL